MTQQQVFGKPGGDDTPEEPFEAGQAQISTTGTEDLLDEIDALLDNNAEEFVRSFVQKGGQ
ncbi:MULTISPECIES: ubiquitin-like protein Pup [Corynebacterium]|uniref:Prokaryotic ubiquitin-like protein Pup n=1 Tax=Corynebacterium riegelii TaxID=156976 RepID=A0A0K1RAF4_9CORY|nr:MULTISPECIES: ubiquitin-like protein Pup [Corynebacterium]AKV58394.1 Prokaryotic ubiquitin-like protein Pup [Corynebacterium riegelii]MDK7179601.1 ubiquitin-like protein Pup [Corynebacterium riegelii]OFT75700.1 Prokaryotic ubiquitin-like protein Pup [Corynebacterium sp. HMSC30G07]OFT85909.1 Prokaryotic ubiquitin-like protein Pup [Corynebacterium sp. HMSC29G08]PLA13595.1 ubiquitin-like protein Pup [Corynebacterium riegelii]